MKVYQVEYRAVVTVVEQDMGKAALQGAALIKDNPHLLSVRAVHERNPTSEHPGPKDSQRDSVVANTVHDEQPLNGAACHGCLLISETSCEQHNVFLDRSLVLETVDYSSSEFFPNT